MKKLIGRILALTLSIAMLASLSACSSGSGDVSDSADSGNGDVSDSQPSDTGIEYPTRDISVVVPYVAGGATDLIMRAYQPYLEDQLGTGLIINNITGSAGTIGSAEVINAEPDGYTIGLSIPAVVVPNILGTWDKYFTDYPIIGAFASLSVGLVVMADSEYQDLDDLIDEALANPGTLNIGVAFNQPMHLALLQLRDVTGADFNIVEIGQTSTKAPELLGGRVDAYLDYTSAVTAYLESGDFRLVTIFSDERDELFFPDVITVAELGYDVVDLSTKIFLTAPKDTPTEIIEELQTAMKAACEVDGAQDSFDSVSTIVGYVDGDECMAEMDALVEELTDVVDNLL